MQFGIFANLFTVLQIVSSTQTYMAKAQWCANQVRHIEHISSTTCHVPGDAEGGVEAVVSHALFLIILSVLYTLPAGPVYLDCVVGLVVNASTWRVADLDFIPACTADLFADKVILVT